MAVGPSAEENIVGDDAERAGRETGAETANAIRRGSRSINIRREQVALLHRKHRALPFVVTVHAPGDCVTAWTSDFSGQWPDAQLRCGTVVMCMDPLCHHQMCTWRLFWDSFPDLDMSGCRIVPRHVGL